MSRYALTTPCAQCPFRKDITPFIRSGRAWDILNSQGEFPCHKTTGGEDEDEAPRSQGIECAGRLILLEKIGQPSQLMRITERLRVYDPSKLDMSAPVYDSINDCVAAHRRVERLREHEVTRRQKHKDARQNGKGKQRGKQSGKRR